MKTPKLAGVMVASSLVAIPATFVLAGMLLPVVLWTGWKEKLLKMPPWELLAISLLFALSATWGGNAAYIITFGITILTIGSLNIDWRSKEILLPVVGVLLLGIPISLYILSLGVKEGTAQGQGYAGNASFYAGQLVIVSLLVKWPWNLALASTVGITGARAALIVLLLISEWRVRLTVLGIGLTTSLILWTSFGWAPYERLSMNLGTTGRIDLWKDSLERLNWFGSGMFEVTESHSVYLIIMEGMGFILGPVVLGLLVWRLRSRIGVAILLLGIFDQFWIGTTQGIYLLGVALCLTTISTKYTALMEQAQTTTQPTPVMN